MPTIRDQIEPHLRKAGIKPTAEAIGIHRVSLQRWLAGQQTMTDDRIEAMAAHLGLRLTVRKPRSA